MNAEIIQMLDSFRSEFPKQFSGLKDFDVFAAFASRVLFFNDESKPFDARLFQHAIADGGYDGGIDAVFANPESVTNEVIIVQSKCYGENNDITADMLGSEVSKIFRTLKKLQDGGSSHRLCERCKEAFRLAKSLCQEPAEAVFRIEVVTSWNPRSERRKKELASMVEELRERSKAYGVADVSIRYGDAILNQARVFGQEKPYLPKGVLRMDKPGNILRSLSSSVVNVTGASLFDLWDKHGRNVLGLNLRYHVKKNRIDKDVDSKITATITRCPENFLLFNNGITIVCEDYREGKDGVLTFRNFSIVNGGQTTFNVYDNWRDRKGDFCVQCKIVKVPRMDHVEGERLARDVAESANSQKPIKMSVLRANGREQKELAAALEEVGVFYERKLGAVPTQPKRYIHRVNLEDLGKIGLAGILLMPYEARARHERMFDSPYYGYIFERRDRARIYADLLTLRKSYGVFVRQLKRRKRRPSWCRDKDELQLAMVGEMFVIAAIVFVVRLNNGTLKYSCYRECAHHKDAKALAELVGKRNDTHVLFRSVDSPDQAQLESVFAAIISCLRDAYGDFLSDQDDADYGVVNFVKRIDAFKHYMSKRLSVLKNKPVFRKSFRDIFG